MSKLTVSAYLLKKFNEYNVDHVFGVPGDYLLNFFRDMAECKEIKVITTVDEQGAGFAADAYARLRGFGVVVATYGAGALKLINTTGQAFAERSPVLVISGAPSLSTVKEDKLVHHRIGSFETQHRIYQQITTASAYLNEENAFKEIDRVFDTIKKESAPGYLEIPIDIFDHQLDVGVSRKVTSLPKALPSGMTSQALREVARCVSTAERPVVIVGPLVQRFRMESEVLSWIEKNDFPFVTTILSKSVLPETHPNFLGVYQGAMSRKELTDFVDNSDCVIKLGSCKTDFSTGEFTSKIDPGRVIEASKENLQIGYHTYQTFGLQKFIEQVKDHHFEILRRISKESWPTLPQHAIFKPDSSRRVTMARFFQCISFALKHKKSVVIPDTGTALFGSTEMELPEGCKMINGGYYASMGFAVPGGIGLQCAEMDRRPIVLVGDGCFQMTGIELSTAVKCELSPIVILINNDGYTTERLIQEGPFDDIQPWNYTKINELVGGGKTCKVTTEKDLCDAVKEAYLGKSFSLIEVTLDKMDIPITQQREFELKQRK